MSYKFFTPTIAGLLLLFPLISLAANPTYTPLVGIPGLTDPGLNFGDYINALYALSISIAALLAVIKIVIAGMKYMLSDIVTSKSDAINDIQGAVFGLLVVISAVLILTVINPNLKQTEIFLDPVVDKTTPGAGGGGSNFSGNLKLPTAMNCAQIGTGTTPDYDCDIAVEACKISGGKSSQTTVGTIDCSYGSKITYTCNPDCATVTATCAKRGTPYPSPDGKKVFCIVPY